ncbi:MAG: tRNA (N6-isopentenyl adenosine(37)-C2)-methylthiotransferase MiaB [Helicobacteraceae bacterium]
MAVKKLYIETMGCAMNELDTAHIIAELKLHKNYETTGDVSQADLILINTCSVREKPVAKLFSELGSFNKQKKPDAKIGVCGCTASHLGQDIIRQAPFVNFVLGARNVSKIKDVLEKDGAVEVDLSYDETTYDFNILAAKEVRAAVNIAVGCDKSCTYCIVPATRGKEISIPPRIILEQVKKRADEGVKEIMLLGQNVNSYGKSLSQRVDFSDLLEMVAGVSGIERIRFTSPHPLHMDDKFMEVFSFNPKIAKHMHMPLQSGSTKVLKAMKRGYSKDWFLRKAFKLKDLNKDTTISTDIIVAFPGEDQADFQDTLDVVRQVRFEQIFSFVFSPRPLTKALEMPNNITKEEAKERLSVLQALHKEILQENHARQLGKIFDVLIERQDDKIYGRGQNYYQLCAPLGSKDLGNDGRGLVGQIIKMRTVSLNKGMLEGEILS